MKIEKSFPLPETEPVVPDKLAEFVTTYLPETVKIHVLVFAKGGWSKANGIIIEEGDEASEVYSMIKACADYHCEEHGGETRKYRAVMWREKEDSDRPERRTLSFEVISEDLHDDARESGHMETLRKQADAWQSICEEMRRMTAMALEFGNRSVDRVLEQARQDSERIKPLTELTREMLAHYREGLRMQASAVKEVGEMRVQQQLAEANKSGGSDKFWETFAPAIQVAVLQAQERFLGGKAPAKALPGKPASVTKIERKEHPAVSTPPPATKPEPATAAEAAAPEIPDSISGLSQMVLDNLGAQTLLRLSRALDDEQAEHLDALSGAMDDDGAARAIVGLMRSLTADPAGLRKMQGLLTAPQLTVFRHLAELATRHLDAVGSEPSPAEVAGESAAE